MHTHTHPYFNMKIYIYIYIMCIYIYIYIFSYGAPSGFRLEPDARDRAKMICLSSSSLLLLLT